MKRISAIFILSYGRPDKIKTIRSLQNAGYTGKIYIICSDDDTSLDRYKELYGSSVFVFNKEEERKYFDIGDNLVGNNVVVFARNYNFRLAKQLGITHFVQLDDDYTCFEHVRINSEKIIHKRIKNLDGIIEAFFDFLDTTTVHSIAFAQAGDFIGGKNNNILHAVRRKRKLMNTFFNRTDRPYVFNGRINEDVNCYIEHGMRGIIFLTHPYCSTIQTVTQKNSGGLTDVYLEKGTYIKSFYSVLFNPSAVRVSVMGDKHPRIHHRISWDNAVPCIVSEQYKK